LYLLAFDTIAKSLTLNTTIPAFSLHQYVTSNAARDIIYATTMSEPPLISSWFRTHNNKLTHINTANISDCSLDLSCSSATLTPAATSSFYISDNGDHAFSVGGYGARINALDNGGSTGNLTDEMFCILKQEIGKVGRTRAAMFYSAHGFDVNMNKKDLHPILIVVRGLKKHRLDSLRYEDKHWVTERYITCHNM
jgi:carboxy-cis,cis-muconate cyclase